MDECSCGQNALGLEQGRVYTLTYTAHHAAGNATQATAQVGVPRNKGK